MRRLISAESVTAGQLDKVADRISEAVVDAALAADEQSLVACGTLVASGLAMIAGAMTSPNGDPLAFDVAGLARRSIREAGYIDDRYGINGDTCPVLVAMTIGPDPRDGCRDQRPGGQRTDSERHPGARGVASAYATNEHPSFLPQPVAYADALSRKMDEVRRLGHAALGPSGRAQVTVEYEGSVARRVDSVVIGTQEGYAEDADDWEEIESTIAELVLAPVLDGVEGFDDCALIVEHHRPDVGHSRPACGLTGRTGLAEAFRGIGRSAGGSFSGRDPSSVDRAGTYAGRWVAKNIVATGAAARCEIQLTYAPRRLAPVSIAIDTFGTEYVDPRRIMRAVQQIFDLRTDAIVEALDLRRPIYADVSAYGPFGRNDPSCTWERLDRVDALAAELGLG